MSNRRPKLRRKKTDLGEEMGKEAAQNQIGIRRCKWTTFPITQRVIFRDSTPRKKKGMTNR
jgi:hypothetical protein